MNTNTLVYNDEIKRDEAHIFPPHGTKAEWFISCLNARTRNGVDLIVNEW